MTGLCHCERWRQQSSKTTKRIKINYIKTNKERKKLMTNKRKYLKNILTTVSLASLILGSATAAAVVVDTAGTPAVVQPGGTAHLLAFVSGVDIIRLNGLHDLITGGDVNLSAGAIDINGNVHQTFTVAHNVVYGAGQDLAMNLILNAGSITIRNITDAADDVTVNGGTLTMGNAANDVTVTGGIIAALGTVGNDLIITGGEVTQDGAITGNVDVRNAGKLTGVIAASHVTGTLTMNANATNAVQVGNVTGAVAVAGGTLKMGNATADVTITGGEIAQIGTIGGDVNVSNAGKLTSNTTDITGTLTMQGDSGNVVVNDIDGAVTVAGGNLIAHDIGANDITIDNIASVSTIHDAGRDVIVTAGKLTVTGLVARDATLTLGKLNITGNVGRNAIVTNGEFSANNIAGTLNMGAAAVSATVNDINNAVTVLGGNLTARDITGINDITIDNIASRSQIRNAGRDVIVTTGELTVTGDVARDATLTLGKLNITGNVGGDALVTAGEFSANNIAGKLDFTNNANASATITGTIAGNVDNTSGGGDVGKLHLAAGSVVTGTIGATNTLRLVSFDGAGAMTLTGKAKATKFVVNNAGADVTAAALMTGKVEFAQAGTLTANNGITGDVNFANNAGTLNIVGKITGNVDSTVGSNGTLNFTGISDVTGTIGATNALKLVQFNAGGSAIKLAGVSKAATFKFLAADTVTAEAAITGNVEFADKAGTLEAQDQITGNVTAENVGTLTFTTADGGVTGTIGEANKKLNQINFNGANAIVLNGAVYANNLTYGANATVVSNNGVTSNIDFANKAGTFTLAAGKVITGNVDSLGGPNGTLAFAGNGSVSGKVNNIATITVGAGTASFGDTVKATNITLAANGIAEFTKDVNADVDAVVANNGTVRFNNDSFLTFTGNIGNGVKINTIEIAKKDVKITGGNTKAEFIKFIGTEAATLSIGASEIGGVVSSLADNLHTLELDGDFTTGAHAFGAKDKRLKAIRLKGNYTAKINSTDFYSGIASSAKDQGKVLFAKDGAFSFDLGDSSNSLAEVRFSENGTVKGNVYSKDIIIEANKTGAFRNVSGQTIVSGAITTGAGSTALFGDNSLLLNSVKGAGNVTFEGLADIKGDIGTSVAKAGTVTFASGKAADLYANVYATDMAASGAILNPKANINLVGDLVAKDITVNLASNQVSYVGSAKPTGNVVISTNLNASNVIGNIQIAKGSNIDLSGANTTLVLNTKTLDTDKIDASKEYHVLVPQDENGVKLPTTTVRFEPRDENHFVEWTYNQATGGIKAMDNSKAKLRADLDNKKLADDLANATGDGALIKKDMGLMANAADRNKAAEQLLPINVSAATQQISEVIATSVINTTMSSVGTRLGSFTSPTSAAPSAPMIKVSEAYGVAAGDEGFTNDASRYGVWGAPFYGQATQKAKGKDSGYKSKSTGGTFGFDFLANDDLILGGAFTVVGTNVSHKNNHIGDKTKANTNMFSLYGIHNLPHNFFVQGIASFGTTSVKNTIAKNSSFGMETASGKYDSTTYSGEILGGYNFFVPESTAVLTPMAGLRAGRFNDNGYTETGTKFKNSTISKKSSTKIEGILGARASMTAQINEVIFTPELHGSMNYDFKGKAPRIDARINGMPNSLDSNASKPAKLLVNLGTNLTIKYHMMEYGLGYDAQLAKKYIGHQGSLKVRVNF